MKHAKGHKKIFFELGFGDISKWHRDKKQLLEIQLSGATDRSLLQKRSLQQATTSLDDQ